MKRSHSIRHFCILISDMTCFVSHVILSKKSGKSRQKFGKVEMLMVWSIWKFEVLNLFRISSFSVPFHWARLGLLGPVWGPFGPRCEPFGPVWGPFGPVLASFGPRKNTLKPHF